MILIILGVFIVMLVKYQNNWQKDNQISEVLKILNEKNYDEKTLKLIHDKLTTEEIVDLENKEKIKNLELFIKEKYYEQKMSAEYKLQVTKIVKLENNFTKDFSKDKWREYFNLDLAVGELHFIEINQILNFAIEII